ncbi:hypothetical protein [Sphingomonas sp. SORGH_AS_0879]|uniref:hypothetical protein n=1 Tax=Sphingomonas sp. SORGH_AS_0879 TaxID=3041790 RepID=UPI00278101D0|nr:hypothetical protein [Sphingomonas sp. SORGH_AS_0879]MDQ1232131.1 hypothetical protein [Sphingomonas sp. SORGH_AS_0879]
MRFDDPIIQAIHDFACQLKAFGDRMLCESMVEIRPSGSGRFIHKPIQQPAGLKTWRPILSRCRVPIAIRRTAMQHTHIRRFFKMARPR